MRLVLFGLTGFGNAAFAALRAAGRTPDLVVTRREAGPYPYEPSLAQLDAVARDSGVQVLYDAEGEAASRGAELAILCTYHRIIAADLAASFRHAFNVHPSLLPRYRGPAPCYWVLRNGEAATGVTIHALSVKADRGDIVWQCALDVAPDETQGTLRSRLSALAAQGVIDVACAVLAGRALERHVQDETQASWFGRPPADPGRLDPSWPVETLDRAIRAATPYPGATMHGLPVIKLLGVETAGGAGIGPLHPTDDRTLRVATGNSVLVFALNTQG
jgi:UDP-4-amino-4-deoxy-L-arabinose formyltransferase / UDP-glucuronic acid dehydrogenase (UDP-4-keto-hexauronic acid decarboxylating)